MKPRYTFLLFLLTITCSVWGQSSFPYYTGFDNTVEQAGWAQYRIGPAADPFYDWNYMGTPYSPPNCLIHNYPVGGSQVTEDWFVSPAFNLPQGGTIDSIRYAFSGFGVPQAGDTVAMYILTGSQDPELATSQTLLMDFRDTNYQADGVWRQLTNMTIAANTAPVYLAFRYVTINNWLDVRFDNISISSNATGIADEGAQASIQVYPNPATDYVQLSIPESALNGQLRLEVYDLLGRQVIDQNVSDGKNISLGELSGLYIYRVLSADRKLLSSGQLTVQ